MLKRNTFPGWAVSRGLLQVSYSLVEMMIQPWVWSLSSLLSLYIPLTTELKHPGTLLLRKMTLTLPYLVIVLCASPLALFAGMVRLVLQQMREKYIFHYHRNSFTESFTGRNGVYSIASINTCLFGEAPSRFNNLTLPHKRAKSIGERIVVDQFHYGRKMGPSRTTNNVQKNHVVKKYEPDLKGTVETHFPELDFLCFQEVWQRTYARPLISELKKVYPYILHDIGHWSYQCNYAMYHSGLLFASRYEILDVEFKPYKDKCNFCVVNSKGLLMVKVLLKKAERRGAKRDVGYIFVTHLQAYQGKKKVLDKQLDEIVLWVEEFRKTQHSLFDNVKFDCLAGDFNFDNMSPCDKELYSHRLFSLYEDPCRVRAGVDKPWAIGTELRQDKLWDQEIMTPEGLRSALCDPLQRQNYVVDADLEIASLDSIVYTNTKIDAHGNVIATPYGGKRRVDYVLHRKKLSVVSEFNFVTRLASLTDHVPVAMVIKS